MIRLWEKVRNLFSLILFFMILFRVVWLQLRPYDLLLPPLHNGSSQWFCYKENESFFGSCLDWVCSLPWVTGGIVSWNLKVFFMTIAILMLGIRIISRSWIMAMVCATVLLSRGSLTSMMGYGTPDGILMLACALWVTSLTHLSISCSKAMLLFLVVQFFVFPFIDPLMVCLGVVPFFFLATSMSRMPQSFNGYRGSLFKRMSGSFALWAIHKKEMWFSACFLLILTASVGFYILNVELIDFSKGSIFQASERFDLHYALSLFFMIWGVFWSSESSRRETLCLIVYSMLSLIIGAHFLKPISIEARYLLSFKDVLSWIEPTVLAYGTYLCIEIMKIICLSFDNNIKHRWRLKLQKRLIQDDV